MTQKPLTSFLQLTESAETKQKESIFKKYIPNLNIIKSLQFKQTLFNATAINNQQLAKQFKQISQFVDYARKNYGPKCVWKALSEANYFTWMAESCQESTQIFGLLAAYNMKVCDA